MHLGVQKPAQQISGTIIARVEVDDGHIRIFGRKDILEQAVAAGAQRHLPVRSFVRRWRARQDETANTYVIEFAI
jgi:hypothetical protein